MNIGPRGWAPQSVDPGQGLTLIWQQGLDDTYDIQLQTIPDNFFTQFWYVWTASAFVGNDTLFTQFYGAFEMGYGDDQITNDVSVAIPGTLDYQQSYFLGGPGDDVIVSNDPSPDDVPNNAMVAYGGSDDDTIAGSQNDDVLYGDEADWFNIWPTTSSVTPNFSYNAVVDGNDTISGGDGNDTIVGGGGNDILSGNDGNDTISSTSGNNQFFGGDGADTIVGGTGADFLYGGPRGSGNLDVLTGGGGADMFLLSYSGNSGPGSDFWGEFANNTADTVVGDVVENGLTNFFKESAEELGAGFLSVAVGGVGEALAEGLINWLANLGPSPTPLEDVLVVRDFDPSQDVLVLPTATGVDLSASVVNFDPDAAGDDRTGLKLVDDATGKTYAEVTLGTDFLESIGLTQDDTDIIASILNFIVANPTTVDASGNLLSLSNLSPYLPDGGFTPPSGAALPAGTSVQMYGAVGGLVYRSEPGEYANSAIVGTQYADILTLNPAIKPVDSLQNTADDLTTTQSQVYGLGGDDTIYGTMASDVLAGGDGNDLIYSLAAQTVGEDVSGGGGDDTIFGGDSFGSFDGGDGDDTFGIFYGDILTPMQVFIDLQTGQAGEREAPPDTSAPVGANPPFTPAADSAYAIPGFESAIGGPLNDWIRGVADGTIEGGAGADYIDISAGGITLSYATSSEGVSVEVTVLDGTTLAGGDAEGDVVNYPNVAQAPVALIGSANADTLTVGQLAMTLTGGGGADRFVLVPEIEAQVPIFHITDFSYDDGDRVDVTQLGVTAADVSELVPPNSVAVLAQTGIGVAETIYFDNLTGPIPDDYFILAQSASGAAVADASGSAIAGSDGRDSLVGRGGDDLLFGKGGSDDLSGNGGDDRLDGGDGADTVAGGRGDDTIVGGAGNDSIDAGAGNDNVSAGEGDDRVSGGGGDDLLEGDGGDDHMVGGAGNDSLFGGAGADVLRGWSGDDLLAGGEGGDTLFGGAGNDRLEGGEGADAMRGGGGADLFALVFGEFDGDQVLDFSAEEGDRLVIEADHTVAVFDAGGGLFAVADGALVETIRVIGATVADFEI